VNKRRLCLRSLGPEREGSTWESDQVLRIGRLLDLELVLRDDSVSRQHAEVTRHEEGWVVRDLGSTNGTFVNGVQVGRAEMAVREGDILQCGNLLFAVRFVTEPESVRLTVSDHDMRVEAALALSWPDVPRLQDDLGRSTQPRREQQRLAVLRIGRECQHAGSLDAFLEAVLWEAAEALDARHGCVILRDAVADRLAVRAAFACGNPIEREAWLQNGFVARALEEQRSLLCQQAAAGEEGQAGATLRSLVCALLRSPRKALGILCLARPSGCDPFDREDLAVADALALAVSGGIDNLEQVLQKEQNQSIRLLNSLAQMVELRRGRLCGQPRRATDYALMLAEELKLSALECDQLRIGAPLLELGKIGLRDTLLSRSTPLSPGELAEVRDGTLKGAWLLESIPGMAPLLPIVRNQHECWDGTGFPDGLAGEEIPLLARVVAVADAFDALTGEPADLGRLSPDEALHEIEGGAGTRFDPAMVQALLRLRPRLRRMFHQRELLTDTLSKAQLPPTRQALRPPGRRREPTRPPGG
jgi:pSer/pThr/pTyr-binding forkhead associated (FHA) protein